MIVQNIKKHIENIIFDMFSFSMTIEYAKKGDAQLACPLFQLAKEKKTVTTGNLSIIRKTTLKYRWHSRRDL